MAKTKGKHPRLTLFKRPLKEVGLFLLDILYNAVVIIVLVVLIRTFLISPFRVIGSSMADTLENNEFILIDKLSYRLGEPKRGDPIVFLPPITNKYPPKFEESITADATGAGVLDIRDLSAPKNAFYCRTKLVQLFWFCQDKVKAEDTAYFLAMSGGQESMGELNWRVAQKTVLSPQDIQSGVLNLKGSPNQSYLVRIFNDSGPEYFVKRIIGIPGDTIRIENGLVYLKKSGESDFSEIKEPYLNSENLSHTYFKPQSGNGDFIVPAGHFFALGDNRTHSNDSRHWFSPVDESATPFVSLDNISGKVMLVLWPLKTLGFISGGVLQ
jgi:signal peptidase I